MIQPVVLILLPPFRVTRHLGIPAEQENETNRLTQLLSALAFGMPALASHRRRVILMLTAMIAAIVTRSSNLTGAAFVGALHGFSSRADTDRIPGAA
ncbi:MAG TPA: hypothetical protein VGK83_05695 [Acidimicrobiia bacterium]